MDKQLPPEDTGVYKQRSGFPGLLAGDRAIGVGRMGRMGERGKLEGA